MISCPLCTKTWKHPSALTHHMVTHTKEKPHKCDICSAAFGAMSSLRTHIKGVHDGIRKIKNKNSRCSLCSYECSSKYVLEVHSRKHFADRPFSCKIPSCGFKTKHEHSLQRHVRGVHNNERPYECPSEGCHFKSQTMQNLQQHVRVHSNEKPFACNAPGCHYTCKSKQNLEIHFSRAHSDKKCFKCSKCDYRSKVRPDFLRHQRTHFKMKNFQCRDPNCSYQTESHYCYRLHRKTHDEQEKRIHVCTFCFLRFSELNKLQAHIGRHIMEKPYRCSHCEYTSVRTADLRGHARRIHDIHVTSRGEEDKVKKCNTCSKNFWNYSELVLHSMIHLEPVVVLEQLKLQIM